MLPNYLHVGQPKAGSTALHFALAQNPAVCLVPSKEAHFFNTDAYLGGPEAYARHFAHHAGQPIVGDITPAYCLPHALERIATTLPDAKITVCFRHPVARAWSHYFHSVRMLDRVGPFLVDLVHYTEAGLGGQTLKLLYDLFPRENVLPLIYERDFRDIDAAYLKVCSFLGIPAHRIDPAVTAGRSFVPAVTKPMFWGVARDWRGLHAYGPSDVVIETLIDAQVYEVHVKPGQRSAYRHLFKDVTWSLGFDSIAAALQPFAEDVELLRSLLGEAVPEWDAVTALKAPPRLRSRLSLAATLREI